MSRRKRVLAGGVLLAVVYVAGDTVAKRRAFERGTEEIRAEYAARIAARRPSPPEGHLCAQHTVKLDWGRTGGMRTTGWIVYAEALGPAGWKRTDPEPLRSWGTESRKTLGQVRRLESWLDEWREVSGRRRTTMAAIVRWAGQCEKWPSRRRRTR